MARGKLARMARSRDAEAAQGKPKRKAPAKSAGGKRKPASRGKKSAPRVPKRG